MTLKSPSSGELWKTKLDMFVQDRRTEGYTFLPRDTIIMLVSEKVIKGNYTTEYSIINILFEMSGDIILASFNLDGVDNCNWSLNFKKAW